MNRLSKNEEHIKKTLNEQEFSFDPTHWEGAEAMLDSVLPVEPKKKKRRFGFFWLTLTFLVASGGVFWWVYSQDIFTAPTTLQQWSASTATNQETEEGFITEPQTDSQYTQEDNENQDQTNEENNQAQNSSQVGGPPTLMAAQYSNAEQKQKSEQSKNEISTGAANQTSTPTPENTKQAKGDSNPNNAPTSETAQPKSNNPERLLQADNGGEIDKKGNDSNNGGDNDLGKTIPPQGKGVDQNNSAPPAIPNNTQGRQQGKGIERSTSPNTSAQTSTSADTATTANDVLAKDEKKDAEKEKNKKGGVEKQVLLKNSLSPVLGSNYTRLLQPSGYQYNNRIYFGLLYNYYFNTRWQVAAGLGYSTVGVNGFAKQYIQQTYSFGVQTQQTTISTQKLHYMEVPVLARYALGQNISFVGGANINYLINTNNTLSQYSFASLSGETNSSSSASAYMRGLNRWDVQLQLGIEASVWQRIHLGLLANSGLIDVGINNYYNNTVFDRNRRLQLYIRYDIFRF